MPNFLCYLFYPYLFVLAILFTLSYHIFYLPLRLIFPIIISLSHTVSLRYLVTYIQRMQTGFRSRMHYKSRNYTTRKSFHPHCSCKCPTKTYLHNNRTTIAGCGGAYDTMYPLQNDRPYLQLHHPVYDTSCSKERYLVPANATVSKRNQ